MKGDEVMARNSGTTGWLNRQVAIPVKWILTAIIVLPVLFLYLRIASNPDDNVALTRNEVAQDAAGGRTWFGRFNGSNEDAYREVAATVRFLDSSGQPVGEVSAHDDLLEAGEGLDLQAALPPEASMMQMYSLQWRAGRKGERVIGELLGPYFPWQFGYLQRDTSR
jgi:hypothetical protein